MSSTAAVVCMTSSTRTMERVFVASARSEASKGVLIGRKAAARRVETHHASHLQVRAHAQLAVTAERGRERTACARRNRAEKYYLLRSYEVVRAGPGSRHVASSRGSQQAGRGA